MTNGTLKIQMLSDWHIGSGTGRPGNIDRLVQRDTHNLPYIPAKSLTGIWRDGCELVAQGLDAGGADRFWQQWVNWLFGEQQPGENENRAIATAPLNAKLSVRSAHFPQVLRNAFQGNAMLQNMTTFIKPGVKINSHTGSALADCLRFEEMTRSGALLEAEYSLDLEALSSEQQQVAQAVLVAGALMVERLGAKRRRGAGRCKISVNGLLKEEDAIQVIEGTGGQPVLPPEPILTNLADTLVLGNCPDSGWWRIVLSVATQSPVIIHKRTVGNHQETQDYIPGTLFVPIILRHLRNIFQEPLDNALMHGDIVITNANPVIDGDRTEAVPFAIFEPKAKTEQAIIHQRIGEAIETNIADGQQLKGMRQGYVCLKDQKLHRKIINFEVSSHNTIVDAKQRPDSEVGGIYTYAAIPTGTLFQLEIRIRDYLVPKTAVNPLANFLNTATSVQIGRTRKDDYGKVKLQQVKSEKLTGGTQNLSKILIVWLLSDVLIRDDRLRPSVDPQVFARRLATQLGAGVTLTLLEQAQTELPPIKQIVAFARSSRTESWQTKWGLPRPSLIGLSAGTVLHFTIDGNIDSQKLHALEISGFGERTAEGYGQLCFNPPLLTQTGLEISKESEVEVRPTSQEQTYIAEGSPGYDYAKLIEIETWREMMRRAAGAIAADSQKLPLNLNSSKLSRSKLGTLRTLIDGLSSPQDATRVKAVLTNLEAKENWKGETLKAIKQLIEDPQRIWQYYQEIGCNFTQYRLTTLDPQELKNELWVEAVRILVDACVRAHKRMSE